jgi:hypothetical protein
MGRVRVSQLRTLKFFSMLFLLPGLAGLIVSAMVSTHYLDTLPKSPVPEEMRMIPRGINGTVVYQTAEEDRRLTLMECTSVGIFVLGLGLSVVYLEKWSSSRERAAEEGDELLKDVG